MPKILATIGPISENFSNIKKILSKTNLIRLNGAHNSIEWHEKVSKKIKKINPNARILLDLPGIKPRTLNEDSLIINKGEIVYFTYGKISKKKNKIIQISKPFPFSKNINFLSLSDGKYKFKILEKKNNYIKVKSKENFLLKKGKGVNIPHSIYSDKFQEKVYLNFLNKSKNIIFDAVGLSFVQNEKIIKKIRKKIPDKLIVSKIENTQGCMNLEEIINQSDLIMIDRGDLSAEIGDANLFSMIENICKKTKEMGKPLIMATENLESMLKNSSPSKSEIVSLGYSLQLFSDVIMLSDETATSINFLKILNWLSNFLKTNNNNVRNKKNGKEKFDLWKLIYNIDQNKTNLIIFTRKGYAIDKILSIKPNIKIFVFTDNKKIITKSNFISNCKSFFTDRFPINMDKFISKKIKQNKKIIFSGHNQTLLIYVSFPRAKSRANTISNINRNDF